MAMLCDHSLGKIKKCVHNTATRACTTFPAPKSGLFGPGFKIAVEDIKMRTHLASKQPRTHNKRKEALEILRLREHCRSTAIGWFNMEFVQAGNGKHGRALPRKQALSILLWRFSHRSSVCFPSVLFFVNISVRVRGICCFSPSLQRRT